MRLPFRKGREARSSARFTESMSPDRLRRALLNEGSIKWALRRTAEWRGGYWPGLVLAGLVLWFAAYIFAVPLHPTNDQIFRFGLLTLIAAALAVNILLFVWSFLRAPYEQRNGLRLLAREYEAEASRRKDRRFADHLRDQQEFAKRAMEDIKPETRMGRVPGWQPTDYTPSEMDAMSAHFPKAAEFIREWTTTAEAWKSAVPALDIRLHRMATDFGGDIDATGSGLVGVFSCAAKDWRDITKAGFKFGDGHLTFDMGPGVAGYTIGRVRSQEEADALRDRVLLAVQDVKTLPEVKERDRLMQVLDDLRSVAYDELYQASKTYDLSGTCRLCPSTEPTP